MMPLKYLAVTIVVVAVIGVGAYAPMILGPSSSNPGTTTATCTTTGSSTAQGSTATQTSNSIPGSFTYSPAYPVKVESVGASTYQGSNGTMVTFEVTYENVGSYDVYTAAGCGSSLVATLPPGNGVLKQVYGGPVCLCAEAITPILPGGNRTSVTPGCWTVDKIMVAHPGTVQVELTLSWSTMQDSPRQDITNITATFAIG